MTKRVFFEIAVDIEDDATEIIDVNTITDAVQNFIEGVSIGYVTECGSEIQHDH